MSNFRTDVKEAHRLSEESRRLVADALAEGLRLLRQDADLQATAERYRQAIRKASRTDGATNDPEEAQRRYQAALSRK